MTGRLARGRSWATNWWKQALAALTPGQQWTTVACLVLALAVVLKGQRVDRIVPAAAADVAPVVTGAPRIASAPALPPTTLPVEPAFGVSFASSTTTTAMAPAPTPAPTPTTSTTAPPPTTTEPPLLPVPLPVP